MTGQTGVGKTRRSQSTHKCVLLIGAPTSKFHQGPRPGLIESPDVWLQSLPSRRHRLSAWQTGATMYDFCPITWQVALPRALWSGRLAAWFARTGRQLPDAPGLGKPGVRLVC